MFSVSFSFPLKHFSVVNPLLLAVLRFTLCHLNHHDLLKLPYTWQDKFLSFLLNYYFELLILQFLIALIILSISLSLSLYLPFFQVNIPFHKLFEGYNSSQNATFRNCNLNWYGGRGQTSWNSKQNQNIKNVKNDNTRFKSRLRTSILNKTLKSWTVSISLLLVQFIRESYTKLTILLTYMSIMHS